MKQRKFLTTKLIVIMILGVIVIGGGIYWLIDSHSKQAELQKLEETSQTVMPSETEEVVLAEDKVSEEALLEPDESGVIQIDENHFVTQMDQIFEEIDRYEGKQLTYEGFVASAGLEDVNEQKVVARYYELMDGDHSHTILVGLQNSYTGQWPEDQTWVSVTGILKKGGSEGSYYPILEIQEMIPLDEPGLETVID